VPFVVWEISLLCIALTVTLLNGTFVPFTTKAPRYQSVPPSEFLVALLPGGGGTFFEP